MKTVSDVRGAVPALQREPGGFPAPLATFADILSCVHRLSQDKKRLLVVIGGCARSGKSTLARGLSSALQEKDIETAIVAADNWIVDVHARPLGAGLFERFETDRFAAAVAALMSGAFVRPPVYDARSRRRVAPESDVELRLSSGVLIAEGVVALLLRSLVEAADLCVYVHAPDDVRKQRLLGFSMNVKGLSEQEASSLIAYRANEEDAQVERSIVHAHVGYIASAV